MIDEVSTLQARLLAQSALNSELIEHGAQRTTGLCELVNKQRLMKARWARWLAVLLKPVRDARASVGVIAWCGDRVLEWFMADVADEVGIDGLLVHVLHEFEVTSFGHVDICSNVFDDASQLQRNGRTLLSI